MIRRIDSTITANEAFSFTITSCSFRPKTAQPSSEKLKRTTGEKWGKITWLQYKGPSIDGLHRSPYNSDEEYWTKIDKVSGRTLKSASASNT